MQTSKVQPLNEEQKREYVKDPGRCPFCSSENIHDDDYGWGAVQMWMVVRCGDCDNEWREWYAIKAIEDIE